MEGFAGFALEGGEVGFFVGLEVLEAGFCLGDLVGELLKFELACGVVELDFFQGLGPLAGGFTGLFFGDLEEGEPVFCLADGCICLALAGGGDGDAGGDAEAGIECC